MERDQNVIGETAEEVLRDVLPSVTDPIIVNPSADTSTGLVAVLTNRDVSPVQVLATDDALRPVRDDFYVASQAADLVAADRLELRSGSGLPPPAVVTDDGVVALLAAGDRAVGLPTTDDRFVANTGARTAKLWESADEFPLRTPAISEVRSDLAETFGPDVRDDFDAVVAAEDPAVDADLDRATLLLLVAAKHRLLFYDISNWAQDMGVASRPTCSKTKTDLEAVGVLDIEKVQMGAGRPRHRLVLGDDRLRQCPARELVQTAREMLATASDT